MIMTDLFDSLKNQIVFEMEMRQEKLEMHKQEAMERGSVIPINEMSEDDDDEHDEKRVSERTLERIKV